MNQGCIVWTPLGVIAFFAAAFASLAPGYAVRYHLPFPAAAGIYLCFVSTLVLLVVPSLPPIFEWKPNLLLFAPIWLLPYLVYAAGTGDFHWTAVARLLLVALPLLLVYGLLPVTRRERFAWQDLAIAAWLIAVVLANLLKGVWTVPAHLDFMDRLFLINIAVWTWTFVRGVPGLGYAFAFSLKTFTATAFNFGLFALIAIPVSLGLHFTAWNPKWRGLSAFCLDYLGIFLFIALLEELFFRGFLQTLISENLASVRAGRAVAACLFGLFHILHAPFPNWRYVLLASVAGWFYGRAFGEGGNLMAPALTHALVDTLWRTFLIK